MTDKTEGLSYTEAIKVYAHSDETGWKIVDCEDDEFWIEEGMSYSSNILGILQPAPDYAPFRVIKPEPKRKLAKTLEEALRAKLVRVCPPKELIVWFQQLPMSPENVWMPSDVSFLDTALRNGWDVEILED